MKHLKDYSPESIGYRYFLREYAQQVSAYSRYPRSFLFETAPRMASHRIKRFADAVDNDQAGRRIPQFASDPAVLISRKSGCFLRKYALSLFEDAGLSLRTSAV